MDMREAAGEGKWEDSGGFKAHCLCSAWLVWTEMPPVTTLAMCIDREYDMPTLVSAREVWLQNPTFGPHGITRIETILFMDSKAQSIK
jgi:hypothetical protein